MQSDQVQCPLWARAEEANGQSVVSREGELSSGHGFGAALVAPGNSFPLSHFPVCGAGMTMPPCFIVSLEIGK